MDSTAIIRHLRWMLIDSLSNAINTASRCQDATAGAEEMLLFGQVRDAIFDLRDNHPAMRALASAANREIKRAMEGGE